MISDGLTKHMAAEWGMDRVRVVSVAPGPIANTVGWDKLGTEFDIRIIIIGYLLCPHILIHN